MFLQSSVIAFADLIKETYNSGAARVKQIMDFVKKIANQKEGLSPRARSNDKLPNNPDDMPKNEYYNIVISSQTGKKLLYFNWMNYTKPKTLMIRKYYDYD